MKQIPKIIKKDKGFLFTVDGEPFLALAAETHNSACSYREYMKTVWQRVKELHCNTLLAPVYWETFEPVENQFDFTQVKELILDARSNGIKLILLWFGSWKNGLSTYVPGWIKLDQKRFPRTEDETGKKTRILSMFQSSIFEIESKAFEKLMSFLKEYDQNSQTVIGIQVENEVGILGSSRDFSLGAEENYKLPVPKDLLECVKDVMNSEEARIQSWGEVFKENADEAFMCWHYSRYIESLAEKGKECYALPMFVNVWLKDKGDKPGTYPSGGPEPEMLSIWKCGAPHVDSVAPDIYTFQFEEVANEYSENDNPLIIPETRRDKWAVPNLYTAIGFFNALCYSPFGIESIGEDKSFITQIIHTDVNDKNVSSGLVKEYLSQSYQMFSNMMPVLLRYYGTDRMIGFAQKDSMKKSVMMDPFKIDIEFYHPVDDMNQYIPAAGIVIRTGEFEFIFIGYGYRANVGINEDGKQMDFLSLEKGSYDDTSMWNRTMLLNGDEQYIRMEERPTIMKATYYVF